MNFPANSETTEEPGDEEPGQGEPGDGEPGDEEPGDGEPGDEEPGDGEPGQGEPGEGEPGEGEPGQGEPGDGEPGEGEPGDGEPGDGEPGEGEPGEGEPGEGEPGEGEPGGKDPIVIYTVVFNPMNGEMPSIKKIKKNNTVARPDDPVRTGYTFDNWYSNNIVYDFEAPVTGNINLVAKYAINTYTVTFNSNGGGYDKTITVNYGAVLTEPSVSREGYTFDNWYLNSVVYDFNTPVTGNMTLVAKYAVNTYTVTFNSNGGGYDKTITVNYGAVLTEPSVSREGYTFDNWYLNSVAYDFNTPVTGNMTLVAKYAVNTYTVTFNSNGGGYDKTITVNHGAVLTEPAVSREGYTFDNWYLNSVVYDFNTPVTGNMTLFAKYTVNTYTVTFHSNGGGYDETITVTYGAVLTEPSVSREGYTFDNWYLNSVAYDFNTPVTGNMTLFAKYTVNTYTVTFNSNGGGYDKTITVTYGAVLTEPSVSREGYTFDNWYLNSVAYDFNTPVTGNMTLFAKYTVNTYTVTFHSNGGGYDETITVTYGAVLTEPSVSREGYTLKGWYTNSLYDWNTKVTGNLDLYAQWDIKSYTIFFMDGDAEISSTLVNHGTAANKPAHPEKEGYRFINWYYDKGLIALYNFTDLIFSDTVIYAKYASWSPESLILTPGATESNLGLNWYSEPADGSVSHVRLFDNNNTLLKTVTSGSSGTVYSKRWHKATVTGLSSGTSYKYSVSNDGIDWSIKYDYKTGSSSSFKFAFVGDTQLEERSSDPDKYGSRWGNTLKRIEAKDASFVVLSGDQVNRGTEAEYSIFYRDEMQSMPMVPVLGTHDSQNGNSSNAGPTGTTLGLELYEAHFNPANSTTTTGATNQAKYMEYYRYNNVLVIVLNTGIYAAVEGDEEVRSSINRWNSFISSAKAANPGVDWVFVVHHQTSIPIGHYKTDDVLNCLVTAKTKGSNLSFEGMMVNQGVDFVLAGHEHVYARSHIIRNDSGTNTLLTKQFISTSSSIVNPNGPIYFTAPSSSDSKHYTENIEIPAPPHIAAVDYPYSAGNPAGDEDGDKKKAGYILFDVNGKSVTVTSYTYNPTNLNPESVIETFSVSK